MRRHKVLFAGLVLALVPLQAAWAIDPRKLLARGKASFTEMEGPRGSGLSVETLETQQASQQALVDQKNMLLAIESQPVIAAAVSTTMEATSAATMEGWSGGSTYPFLLFDPRKQGRGYALSDSSGIYRTDDGGNNWVAINKGITNLVVASIAIAPSDSNILYAGSAAGVQRSNDAGLTWTFLQGSQGKIAFKRISSYRALAVHPTNPNLVYAGSSSGQFFHSANGGATWTQVGNLGIGVPVSAIHRTQDGRFFAGSSKGLQLYRPATGLWQKITLQSTSGAYDIVSVVNSGRETIYVTNGLRVAYTSDLGVPVTWKYTAAVPAYNSTTPGYATRLAIRRNPSTGQTQILVARRRDWQGNVFLSSDNGGTWKNLSRNYVLDLVANPTRSWKKTLTPPPFAVAFDPFTVNTFYMTDDWAIWRSTDTGNTWYEKIRGTPNVIGTALTYDRFTGTYLVGSMDDGLVEINPVTGAMKAVYPTPSTPSNLQGHVWRVEVLANRNRVLTLSPWNGATNVVVVVKPDGTVTLAKGLPALFPRWNTVWDKGYPRGLAVDPKNPNRLYLGIDGNDGGGLFISNDGGFNWTRSTGQPASRRVYYGLAVDPVETNRIYWGSMWSGSVGGVFMSQDSGATWNRVFSGSGSVADIAVGKDQVVYAGVNLNGQPALVVSVDKGVTWKPLKTFDGTGNALQAITIDPNDPRRIAVSSRRWNDYADAKIYITRDTGATWQEISTNGLPNTSGAAEMTFAPDGQSLYVLLNAGTLYNVPLG